jgi:hypothetical protein
MPGDLKPVGSKRGLTWAGVCRLAKRHAGVEEGVSYRTPALRVRRKLLVRLKEDGATIALEVDPMEREILLEMDPDAFYLTDHYRPYPYVLVRLGEVRIDQLDQLLERAWSRNAPKALLTRGKQPREGRG